jgi:hypothetical protein
MIAYGIRGSVVDQNTSQPIEGVAIEAQMTQDTTRVHYSDAQGEFQIKPVYQYHWGFFFGVALSYSLPYWKQFPTTPMPVSVTDKRYGTTSFIVIRPEMLSTCQNTQELPCRGAQYVKGKYLYLGPILLSKPSCTQSEHPSDPPWKGS